MQEEGKNMNIVSQNQMQGNKVKVYRFDVFKGRIDDSGKIEKINSVGHSTLYEGSTTYTLYLRMFLKDQFYLLPEQEAGRPFDFVILTREPSSLPGKKYFWNRVGTAKLLGDQNSGIMKLDFDLLACVDLYLNFHGATTKELETQSNPAA
jgi:hypothetical protein